MRAVNSSSPPELFFILFWHPKRGPLLAWLLVTPTGADFWKTEWDIGTIDTDPRLSDDWFCQDCYDQKFIRILQSALERSRPHFELPCATSRWGSAKGMRRKPAIDLANQVLGLWEEILTDWEARPA